MWEAVNGIGNVGKSRFLEAAIAFDAQALDAGAVDSRRDFRGQEATVMETVRSGLRHGFQLTSRAQHEPMLVPIGTRVWLLKPSHGNPGAVLA
jgi:hypothetical protein